MYKILIVDDEAVVREGMRDNVHWEEHGFILSGVYENGIEAMEAVDRIMPDVILTDICMPFMSGMELSQNILNKYPHIKIVILTGYEEFVYAQQAVKLKAYDFILKPITACELRKVLDKIKNELDIEKAEKDNINRLKIQLRESFPLLKERFLNRLVSGNLKTGELSEKLQYFNIKLPGKYFISIIVDIDDYGELTVLHPGTDDELLIFAVFNICEEIAGANNDSIIFQNRNNKTVIIISSDNMEDIYEKAVKTAEGIKQSVQNYLKFTVTVGIGSVCQDIENIAMSYEKSLSALDYRFLLGKSQVISVTDMERNISGSIIYNRGLEKKLVSSIKIGSDCEISNSVSKIINYLEEFYVSMNKCHLYIHQLIASLLNMLGEFDVSDDEIFNNDSNPFMEIYSLKTLDEMHKWLDKLCKRICDIVSAKRNDFCEDIVIKAKEYIYENYNDGNISLNSLCKYLLISTSYFSLTFKNTTGETFIEYLTRVRIEKAMELLKNSSLKTYEIADKIGYSDPHYFSIAFKKAIGMAPTEYRESVKRENLM